MTEAERKEHWETEVRKIWYPETVDSSEDLPPYEPDVCSVCGREMVQGDWPYCKGNMSDHITARSSRNAARVKTILYEGPNGEVWVPTSEGAKPPKSYERVELTSLQQVDKYMAQINRVKGEMCDLQIERDKQEWSEYLKSARRDMESYGFVHNGQQLPGVHSMTALGREMYEEAMRKAQDYNPRRAEETYLEAQYFDASSMRDR